MKRIYTGLFFVLFFCSANLVQAQFAQGCDGIRYSEDVFDDYTITTVQYGTNTDAVGNSFDLEMDIYQPVGDVQEKRPLMIWAHGGVFMFGERSDVADNCIEFAKKGFVTATISYRLFPVTVLGIPDSLEIMDASIKAMGDMKAAIRYFRQDADTDNLYQIDPDNIIVGGYSAGAIMAVHIAYLEESDNVPDYMTEIINTNGGFEGSTGDATNQSYSSDVIAAVNLSGALHRREWMSSGEPALASYHGTSDETVPYNHGIANALGFDFLSLDGSGVLHQRADQLGIYNFHVAAPGGGHGDSYEAGFAQYYADFNEGGKNFFQTVLCSASVSVDDKESQGPQVSVYPNPSRGTVHLEVASDYGQGYTVELHDQIGRQVRSFGDQYDPTFQIDRGNLSNGVYFLQINFNDPTIASVIRKITFQ